MKNWVKQSINRIKADQSRSADTHLLKICISKYPNIHFYLKDESTHPTGSLKHRLARSLFLYALCNGKINKNTTIVEASSGSTAVSEAYFARMIGVPFIAVVPKSTAQSKVKLIEFYAGKCTFVDSAPQMHHEASRLASKINGYFMDQFKYAERATDWRGNNNIAQSIFNQMEQEQFKVPTHIVMGAGTGGTSATIGRYILYKGYDTKLLVVDPENSVFYESFQKKDWSISNDNSSRIEGIGRPTVEASFQPDVINQVIQVPDAASVAAILWLEGLIGKKVGPSTGTNLWGAIQLAEKMNASEQSGSIVTLICDSGDRYLDTYYRADWVTKKIGNIHEYSAKLNSLLGP